MDSPEIGRDLFEAALHFKDRNPNLLIINLIKACDVNYKPALDYCDMYGIPFQYLIFTYDLLTFIENHNSEIAKLIYALFRLKKRVIDGWLIIEEDNSFI